MKTLMTTQGPALLLSTFLADWPQFDESREEYENEVNGGDMVDYMAGWANDAKVDPEPSAPQQPTGKHTPGPWDCRPTNSFTYILPFLVPRLLEREEIEANARVIGAAAELLASLKEVCIHAKIIQLDGSLGNPEGLAAGPMAERARAAIRKAEGGVS